jgi:5-methylphenazine-1-carboxylate 1-monooxygenase
MILIAGAGIAGLTLGLTLHQLKLPFRIYEAVPELKPLGLGVNLQPNAVRELFDLGLEGELDKIGVRTRQYGFYTRTGLPIWEEPRGLAAGYKWPQFSIHRGRLQQMLQRVLIERSGSEVLVNSSRITAFTNTATGVSAKLENGNSVDGKLLIASDGIHSNVRAQMFPNEGPPIWNGVILWRALSRAKPFFGGGAMALCGYSNIRFVVYPISTPDPETGLCDLNWIAEKRFDPKSRHNKEDWNRVIDRSIFAPSFKDWKFDWLDVPHVIASAEQVFEYPLVDRDPVDHWTEGGVTLIGDAAHATYPVGSNGASQAIVDARVIGAMLLKHGVHPAALHAYEAQLRPRMEKVILANRRSGPDAVMQLVEDRCQGDFSQMTKLVPQEELAEHAAHYKRLAGFSIPDLNAMPPIIGRWHAL